MKKKIKNNMNRTTSVLVNFYPATQKEINDLLKSLKISGVSVSNLISRWSVEVPFWKENYYIEKLLESEIVQRVFGSNFKKQSELYEEEIEETL